MLFGEVLLSHASSKLSVVFLPLLADLGRVGEYAWGVANLTHLYSTLFCFMHGSSRQLGGNLPFLQVKCMLKFVTFRNIAGYYVLLKASLFFVQMWAWDHFVFLRPAPPPVPPVNIPFPRALFWANAEQALEPADDNRYVGHLLFELLVPTQVIYPLLTFQLLFIYLCRLLTCIAPFR